MDKAKEICFEEKSCTFQDISRTEDGQGASNAFRDTSNAFSECTSNEYDGDDIERLCSEETAGNHESSEKFRGNKQISCGRYFQICERPVQYQPNIRRCAVNYRSSTTSFIPAPSERKLFDSRHSGNYIERWRGEWGNRPTGFREGRDFHYWWWRRTYIDYLRIIYERVLKAINSYKKGYIRRIRFEEFIDLAYINSSGYIINYT